MPESLDMPLLAALGFLLGFFFTRTMRAADNLPEKYTTKEDCRNIRSECRRGMEIDREELLELINRIEAKLDRLIENHLRTGAGA